MSDNDENTWVVNRHKHDYMFMSGGELGSPSEVIDKARSLTGDDYPDDVAIMKYEKPGSTCYAVYDSQAPVKLKAMFLNWCSDNKNTYYHDYDKSKAKSAIAKKIKRFRLSKSRFSVYGIASFIAIIAAFVNPIIHCTNSSIVLAILTLFIGVLIIICSINKYVDTDSWSNTKIHQFNTNTDTVYIINGLKYNSAEYIDNDEPAFARKLIKVISKATGINRKSISYRIIDHGIAIIHKNPDPHNKTIDCTTKEIIRHFSNPNEEIIELKKLNITKSTNTKPMTKNEIKTTLGEMVSLQSSIRDFEGKALASSNISDKVDAQVKAFKALCESEHAAMASGEELLNKMKNINDNLEKLSQGNITLDNVMRDLDDVTRVKTQSR